MFRETYEDESTRNKSTSPNLAVCVSGECGTSKFEHFLYILCTAITLVANFCGLVASLAFFLKFVSLDFELSLHALIQISVMSSANYMTAVALFFQRKVNGLFERLTEIYDAGKY